jgi:hypothetical protein
MLMLKKTNKTAPFNAAENLPFMINGSFHFTIHNLYSWYTIVKIKSTNQRKKQVTEYNGNKRW